MAHEIQQKRFQDTIFKEIMVEIKCTITDDQVGPARSCHIHVKYKPPDSDIITCTSDVAHAYV